METCQKYIEYGRHIRYIPDIRTSGQTDKLTPGHPNKHVVSLTRPGTLVLCLTGTQSPLFDFENSRESPLHFARLYASIRRHWSVLWHPTQEPPYTQDRNTVYCIVVQTVLPNTILSFHYYLFVSIIIYRLCQLSMYWDLHPRLHHRVSTRTIEIGHGRRYGDIRKETGNEI